MICAIHIILVAFNQLLLAHVKSALILFWNSYYIYTLICDNIHMVAQAHTHIFIYMSMSFEITKTHECIELSAGRDIEEIPDNVRPTIFTIARYSLRQHVYMWLCVSTEARPIQLFLLLSLLCYWVGVL